MKAPTRPIALVVAFLLVVSCVVAEDQPEAADKTEAEKKVRWERDFDKAKEAAAKQKRSILASFEGTDWCYWCKKLRSEVWVHKPFQDFAERNLVLFLADFPREEKLPEREAKQNADLAREHEIQGFPTVLILDAQGKALARTGYREGGAQKYVEHLEELMAKAEEDAKIDEGRTRPEPSRSGEQKERKGD